MTVTVYYDSTCPVCLKRTQYYQQIDRKQKVLWQDIAETREGLEESISNRRIGMLLHVRDHKGDIKKGIHAYNTLWRELRNFCVLAFFTSLHTIKWIFLVPSYAFAWRLRWHMGHKKYHKQ